MLVRLQVEGEHTGFLYCGSLGNLVLAVINVPASLLGGFLATLLRIGLLHCNCLFPSIALFCPWEVQTVAIVQQW